MSIRTRYDAEVVRPTINSGPTVTKQSMKEECDINNILARYVKTGLLTPVVKRPPMFMDVSNVGDYRTAVENVQQAQELFANLDSGTRARFNNDPAEFLDFAVDNDNRDELRELGLLPKADTPVEEEGAPDPPETPSED